MVVEAGMRSSREGVDMNYQETVLLTGSSGFTGQYVRSALQSSGYRVAGLASKPTASDEVRADLEDIDSLRAAIAVTQPDYVIHLAGVAFVANANAMEFYRVNLFGTLNLLQALKDTGGVLKKVVLSSSASVYGRNPVSPVCEDVCPAPVNHYAMSKLAMEHFAKTWMDVFPIVITRPFNYTGAGQSSQYLIPKLVEHFGKRKETLRLGNLDVVREFNDVRMVAEIYVRLMTGAPPCTVVNLCTGKGYRLADILALLERMTKHMPELQSDPALMRASEIRVLVGDHRLLDSLVPDRPQFSIEDTLQYMLAEARD
jgi:nucleoside-diphosphate-sugar epimerase